MVAILSQPQCVKEMTYSNAFSWMWSFAFWFNFCWTQFPRIQLATINVISGNGFAQHLYIYALYIGHHRWYHYCDAIMGTVASQITSLTIVYTTVYSDADQSKHQSSASLAFVWGIHRGPVNSPHKWPVTRKMLPFDDVIMIQTLHKKTYKLIVA